MDGFLDLLACPVCRGELSFESVDAVHGWLACDTCISLTPVVFGMVLFTESRQRGQTRPDIAALALQLAGSEAEYEDYIEGKRERGLVDAYAAFEPFNESMRCAPPLLRAARDCMAAGAAVLDLGIRTGWSGAMLAGLLPRQRVVSVCWSGAGVLGYRGFRHWFGGVHRIANLLVVFSPMTDALPVRDGAFALVHSYDSLHRSQSPMLFNNALRAAQPGATIVHAHVHLADAEPEPYFERGGILRKAADYRDFLASRLREDPRTAIVAREAALFAAIRAGDLGWDAVQSASGYNGCIVLAPAGLLEQARQRALLRPDPLPGDRMLVSPLLRINPLTGALHIDPSALGGRAQEMLLRHPPYADALRSRLPARLDAQTIALLRIAEFGATIVEVAEQLGLPLGTTRARIASLADQEVLIAAPFAASYHALHRFHGNRRSVLDRDFARVLAEWAAQLPDAPGGSIFGNDVPRRDALRILAALVAYFRSIAIAPGDRVAIAASGPDTLWPLAAGLLVGADLVGTRRHCSHQVDAGDGSAGVAVVDRPMGRWDLELCIGDDAAAPVTLAKVLAAHVDDSHAPVFMDGGNATASPTSRWMDSIGTDAQGKLRLLADSESGGPGLETVR
jgi:hypothetical protein